jgi:hypothetical protein
MNSKIKTLIAAASLVFAIGGAASTASAATWQDQHPRRAEVNMRIDHQNQRIREERRMHVLTAYEGHRLHMADHRVRVEERHFARHNGGHLTRDEQMRLNHQQNAIGRHIG